jgi:hypothetical protein
VTADVGFRMGMLLSPRPVQESTGRRGSACTRPTCLLGSRSAPSANWSPWWCARSASQPLPLARALTLVQAEVARHAGQVVEVVGDVVVAVFGLPRTHDADAERAVLAALAARDRLATSTLAERPLRAGVATGQALVHLSEPADAGGWGLAGEVLAAALAVKDAAPPGAVLVTAATLQATQRAVSYAPVRQLRVAGRPRG